MLFLLFIVSSFACPPPRTYLISHSENTILPTRNATVSSWAFGDFRASSVKFHTAEACAAFHSEKSLLQKRGLEIVEEDVGVRVMAVQENPPWVRFFFYFKL